MSPENLEFAVRFISIFGITLLVFHILALILYVVMTGGNDDND